MKYFELSITCENAAFEDEPAYEIARILREAALQTDNGITENILMDANGNKVGRFDLLVETD